MKAKMPRRPRAAARETWITDPGALLAVLADAERARQAATQPRRVEKPEPLASIVRSLPEAEPSRLALPRLREDERAVRLDDAHPTVIIIRRRRAA